MPDQYLHGIELIEISDGIRPVRTVRSGVIGLIGTAPDADTALFPINEPVLISGNPHLAAQLGEAGTLRDAMDDIYDQIGATVVVVRVTDALTLAGNWANIVGDGATQTGVHAFFKAATAVGVTPRMLIAPGFTSTRPTNAILSASINSGGLGYLSATPPAVTFAAPPAGGVRAEGRAIVIAGSVESIVITKPGAGYTSPPAITIASPSSGSGFTQATATAVPGASSNPVAVELLVVAERMRAMILLDGPATTDAAALTYRQDFGSKRVMIIDPMVQAFDRYVQLYVPRPASARAAGLQAKMDAERGFWWAFSNQEILGVGGTSRPIDFNFTDPHSQANLLNENEITTIVHADGYRFWGVRTTSTDPLYAFWSVVRTSDMIFDSIVKAFRWAIDRPFSKQLLVEIPEAVNDYLAVLVANGAILGGRAWLDKDYNSKAELVAGKLRVEFNHEPPAPLEHLKFGAHREPQYYEVLINDVLRELSATPSVA